METNRDTRLAQLQQLLGITVSLGERRQPDADITLMPRTPILKTAEDLIAEAGCLPPMLIDRLLPDRSLVLLTGKPKAGKSFFALDLADSICRGVPALHNLDVSNPGPVIYLALEDGRIELARRLAQRRFQAANYQLFFIDEPFSLTEPVHFARFRKQVEAVRPRLIVVDTAAEALDIRDWINRSEILAKIAPIRGLARAICTVLLIAHNRKADGDMGDEIDGSNALAGAVDGWISAYKTERRPNGNLRLFLRLEGRGGVGHEIVAEMEHTSLTFTLILPEEVESDAEAARARQRVYKREERYTIARGKLRDLGGQAHIAQLAAAMGESYKIAWAVIREMEANAVVEEIQPSKSSHTAGRRPPEYRLLEPSQAIIS